MSESRAVARFGAARSVLSRRADRDGTMPGEEVVALAEPVLPASVVTAHLATCARALADAEPAVADLPGTAGHLVTAQRDVSAALTRLAARLARGPLSEDRAALVEVLRAAAAASEHAADALDAGGQLFESVANETRF